MTHDISLQTQLDARSVVRRAARVNCAAIAAFRDSGPALLCDPTIVDPLFNYWARRPDSIDAYTAGSLGPAQADSPFTTPDRTWRDEV